MSRVCQTMACFVSVEGSRTGSAQLRGPPGCQRSFSHTGYGPGQGLLCDATRQVWAPCSPLPSSDALVPYAQSFLVGTVCTRPPSCARLCAEHFSPPSNGVPGHRTVRLLYAGRALVAFTSPQGRTCFHCGPVCLARSVRPRPSDDYQRYCQCRYAVSL